jgi:rhodanese-related sulfurtransferase
MRMKLVLGMTLALSLRVAGIQAQEVPITFVKVAAVQRLLSESKRVVLVDVRSHQEYLERHIKGAVSVPLPEIDQRFREIPQQGLVVLY